MSLQSFILYILLSTSTTKVSLFEISSTNPCGLNSIQSSYYLEADINSNHIEPNEELKRTQRSFLKKLWKDSGLQDLFGENGCVNCCNNDNYKAGDGDTYETPPTSSYFQQIPSLSPLQPFDPLRIFQPFLRPMDYNTNGLNGGGQINIYDKGNFPKVYEGENSNVINNDKKGYSNTYPETGETECKDIKKNKLIENNGYSSDKSNNIGPIYTEENEKNYNKNTKETYAEPVEDVYPEPKSKAIQTKQSYPSLDGSNGKIVYQPIIYVSPQYHAAPPLYNAAYNSNQKSEESNLPPSCNNYKGGPDIKVTYSDQCLPCGASPYSTVLSPGLPTYGEISQCSDTKMTQSDIAVYTLVTQIPSTFNDYYKKTSSPITLTEADQPYRNCPELFTDYLYQGNYNQNRAKGNTFVNAHIISC